VAWGGGLHELSGAAAAISFPEYLSWERPIEANSGAAEDDPFSRPRDLKRADCHRRSSALSGSRVGALVIHRRAGGKSRQNTESIAFYALLSPFFKKNFLRNLVFEACFRVPHAGKGAYNLNANRARAERKKRSIDKCCAPPLFIHLWRPSPKNSAWSAERELYRVLLLQQK